MSKTIDDQVNVLSDLSSNKEANDPVHLNLDEGTGDLLLIYAEGGDVEIEFKYSDETLWMTQGQIAELFGRDQTTISRHISNIISDEELDENSFMQKMHKTIGRPTTFYNLDMIISVGYRVSSKQATLFRRWATDKLVQFATKGFVIDAKRLKAPESQDHFKELRETIRDIRASEANIYREVRSICAMCQDYDPSSQSVRKTFAIIQNTLLYAVASSTAPEIIVQRANASSMNMGLTNWPHENIRKHDVTIAHNYLAEPEIKSKNLLTTMLLDYFESRLDQGKLTLLIQVKKELEKFIQFNEYPLLRNAGSVKRTSANKHAEKEFKIFAEKRRALRHENP